MFFVPFVVEKNFLIRKEITMSHNRDKGSKEQKKKAKRNIKEKRKLKKEKKQKNPFGVG